MKKKLKMVSTIAVIAVAFLTIAPVASEQEEEEEDKSVILTTTEDAPDIWETTTENSVFAPTLPPVSDSKISKKKLELTKYGFYDKKRADRGLKPFVFGKKFELQNEFNADRSDFIGDTKQDILPPLSTIRPLSFSSEVVLPSNSGKDLLTLLKETFVDNNPKEFNDTEYAKDVSELENHGGEAAEPQGVNGKPENSEEKNSSLRSRQNSDRSLMVVLPFSAHDNGSMEELFTKKPLIRVIETAADLERKSDEFRGATIAPIRVKETVVQTTTEFDRKSFLTRKPWRPSKRGKITTEIYSSSTESGEEATRTYTNYNDVEQVTQKFNVQPVHGQVSNHNYDVEYVTPYPAKRLRNKTPATVEEYPNEETYSISAPYKSDDPIDLSDMEYPNANFKLKRKIKRKGTKATTTENQSNVEGLKKVLEILPSDMKEVILELDLNNEEKKGDTGKNVGKKQTDEGKLINLKGIAQPAIDPKSYAVFKPIPMEMKDENKDGVSEDMKTFLASFGLLPSAPGKRQHKSLEPARRKTTSDEIPQVNLDFLPENMRLVLRDLGLVKTGKSQKESQKHNHVFNPINHAVAQSQEDMEKVKTILKSIKTTVNESKSLTPEMQIEIIHKIKELSDLRYKSGNITEINKEIKKIILSKFPEEEKLRQKKRATVLSDGPNPLIYADENLSKSEVKRQSASSNSSSSASSESSVSSSAGSAAVDRQDEEVSSNENNSTTSSMVETTTEESPNLEGLRDSFGGGETASDAEDVDSALPPKKPNGLFFLFDWNSFFEVGTEDDSRRVNLRFQPKIGDSRNFLPVTIP